MGHKVALREMALLKQDKILNISAKVDCFYICYLLPMQDLELEIVEAKLLSFSVRTDMHKITLNNVLLMK